MKGQQKAALFAVAVSGFALAELGGTDGSSVLAPVARLVRKGPAGPLLPSYKRGKKKIIACGDYFPGLQKRGNRFFCEIKDFARNFSKAEISFFRPFGPEKRAKRFCRAFWQEIQPL